MIFTSIWLIIHMFTRNITRGAEKFITQKSNSNELNQPIINSYTKRGHSCAHSINQLPHMENNIRKDHALRIDIKQINQDLNKQRVTKLTTQEN